MDKYLISSEDCLILLAIRNSKTLREAARLLECDPGGLLRKVQRIAEEHGVLQKSVGKWSLTAKGLAVVGWTQETILTQKRLLLSSSVLRIGATSWLSERILIPGSSILSNRFENAEIQYSIPDIGYERALIEGDCDFVIVCHAPESPVIAHKRICPEKWSVVASASLVKKHFPNKKISLADLSTLPFIRHHGLNPDSILPFKNSVASKSHLSADNLTGIRAALANGFGWSLVPTALVGAEIAAGTILAIEYDFKMDRHVCLWWLRNSSRSRKKLSVMEEWLRKICSKI